MLRRATRLLVVGSFLLSLDAHLPVIQTMAWTQMFMTFSHHATIQCSLQKTLDGQHPCALCLKIKKASQTGPSLKAPSMVNPADSALQKAQPLVPTRKVASHFFAPVAFASLSVAFTDSPPPKNVLS